MENFIFSTLQESNVEFLSSPFPPSQKQLTGGELCRCPARAPGADTGGFGATALSALPEKGRESLSGYHSAVPRVREFRSHGWEYLR